MSGLKWMSGAQAKLVGAALATVGVYAYGHLTGAYLPAEVGGAIAVLMVAFVDIAFAGGSPTDAPDPVPAPAPPLVPPATFTATQHRP